MALTKCPECKGKVSTKADTCPHCGSPVNQAPEPEPQTYTAPSSKGPSIFLLLPVLIISVFILAPMVWLDSIALDWIMDEEQNHEHWDSDGFAGFLFIGFVVTFVMLLPLSLLIPLSGIKKVSYEAIQMMMCAWAASAIAGVVAIVGYSIPVPTVAFFQVVAGLFFIICTFFMASKF